jgi:hypothetical protein
MSRGRSESRANAEHPARLVWLGPGTFTVEVYKQTRFRQKGILMKSRSTSGRAFGRLLIAMCCLVGARQTPAAAPKPAGLDLWVNGRGEVSVRFYVGTLLPDPPELESAISQVVGLRLHNVNLEVDDEKKVVTFSAQSAEGLSHRWGRVKGQIDPKPLVKLLQPVGVETLPVRISHPRARFSHCSPAVDSSPNRAAPWVEYTCQASVGTASSSPVRFEFGYYPRDLIQAFAPLLVFAIVPVVPAIRRRLAGGRATAEGSVRMAGSRERWLLWSGPVTWIGWCAAVFGAQTDVVSSFLAGLDSRSGQVAMTLVLATLAPALVVGVNRTWLQLLWTQPPGTGTTWSSILRRALLRQLGFLLPAALGAVGLAALRNGDFLKTVEWWGAGGVVALVSVSQALWIHSRRDSNAASLGVTTKAVCFSRSFRRRAALRAWWASTAVIVLTPVAIACLTRSWQLDDTNRWVVYLAGLLATLGLLLWVNNVAPAWGYHELEHCLRARLECEGTLPKECGGHFVGLAPTGRPRVYDHSYDWDMGWLFLTEGSLNYVGEQGRFTLRREQITALQQSSAPPGWWQPPAVVVGWLEAANPDLALLSLRPVGGRSLRQRQCATTDLLQRLESWRAHPPAPAEPPALLSGPGAPCWGEVKGRPPRTLARGLRMTLGFLLVVLIAFSVCQLLDLPLNLAQGDESWYVLIAVGLSALFQTLP